jgi:uncharacterized protein YjbI with pentapeptide repeats
MSREETPASRLAAFIISRNPIDLRGANLRAVNLKGANLSNIIFTEADLSLADLSSSILPQQGAMLAGADFANADFHNTHLEGVDLSLALNVDTVALQAAWGDENTRLPVGVDRPGNWPPSTPPQMNEQDDAQ